MQDLFEFLILKHLQFTSEDLEEFDSNEEAFIQMDLEEHDKETRRRACYNLVVKLSNTFPDKMGEITRHYMSTFVEEYNQNPAKNWDRMIIGLNLLIASTVDRYCFRFGATQI